ncbi:MAG: hypothetical protein OER87_04090 [Gammaproteobacteria bacterium]|nr:hypothetical protein [Gammaproteobacteria bacterium]
MKLTQFSQYKTLGAAAALALLLAAGNASAGKPENNGSNSPKDGGGASIGVSNLCWVEGTNPATLFVETTITDKSSGETVPVFEEIKVQPLQKVRNRQTPLGEPVDVSGVIAGLGDADPDTRQYAPFVTQIDLCAAGLTDDATAVNVNLRVKVFNSNNTYTNSKCTARDEGGLKIGGMGLCQ